MPQPATACIRRYFARAPRSAERILISYNLWSDHSKNSEAQTTRCRIWIRLFRESMSPIFPSRTHRTKHIHGLGSRDGVNYRWRYFTPSGTHALASSRNWIVPLRLYARAPGPKSGWVGSTWRGYYSSIMLCYLKHNELVMNQRVALEQTFFLFIKNGKLKFSAIQPILITWKQRERK